MKTKTPTPRSLPGPGQDKTSNSQTEWEEQYAYSLGIQAYIYGFPWVYLSWVKWLWTTPGGEALAKAEGITLPSMPVNSFFLSPQLATGATPTGGSPNRDTLYAIAWLDLSAEPMVVTVPAVLDRFYCLQLACLDSDNFGYVGTHVTGTYPASYLLAGPGWDGPVKDGILDILPRSRTPEMLIFGRTQVLGPNQSDLDAAQAVQKGFALAPLSAWPLRVNPLEKQEDSHLPENPTKHTEGAWVSMNQAMEKNPPGVLPGIDQTELLKLFATVGVGPGQSLETQSPATIAGLDRAAKDGLGLLHKMASGRGKTLNGWHYPPRDIGRAGQNSDFITRAALQALAGISAHDPQQAVYLNTATDKNGNALKSATKYVLTFDSGFPPFDPTYKGFWSITMYQAWDFNLVAGVTEPYAYSVNSYYEMYKPSIATGKMTIYLQKTKPSGFGTNGVFWLQTPTVPNPPPANMPPSDFYLFLRVYVPGPQIWNTQTWTPPTISPA